MGVNVPCKYARDFYMCNNPKRKKIFGLFRRRCIWIDKMHCDLSEMPKKPQYIVKEVKI